MEAYIEKLPEVVLAAVCGAKHEVYSEGVVAFVELRKGKKLTEKDIMEHCKGLAAYKRPSLVIFLDEIPLNRVDKTDYKILYDMLPEIIEKERAKGRWDAK